MTYFITRCRQTEDATIVHPKRSFSGKDCCPALNNYNHVLNEQNSLNEIRHTVACDNTISNICRQQTLRLWRYP